jgi:metal-responsive CopG/Arc/MetJ family transcriptional regulator
MKKILAVSLDKNVAEGFDKFCYDQRIKNRSRLVQSLIEKHMRENFIPKQ